MALARLQRLQGKITAPGGWRLIKCPLACPNFNTVLFLDYSALRHGAWFAPTTYRSLR